MRKTALLVFFLLLPLISRAQSVDLLSQGEGYVSPFYQGRTLWGKEGELTLVAIPQGLGSPGSLNYRWSRNGTVLGTISGVGRNSLKFSDTFFSKPVTIQVEIVGADESVMAESTMTVVPLSPFLAIYEDNPLYGLMLHQQVVGGFQLGEKEVSFAGLPYFFSAPSRNSPALLYKWDGKAGESKATYRVPEEGSGTSQVSLGVAHQSFITETASQNFLVTFGENEK